MSVEGQLKAYLADGNYEMAGKMFEEQPQELQTEVRLDLGRAYFATHQYDKCLGIVSALISHDEPAVYFQANIIYFKAKFILQSPIFEEFKNFQHSIIHQQGFRPIHHEIVKEIGAILSQDKTSQKSVRELQNEGKNFMEMLRKQQNAGPLEEGMPMFIISTRWFQQWERYVRLVQCQNPKNPGPISHFQILDHRFDAFYDRRQQKKYTNYNIFMCAQYMMIPKSCWEFLKQKYSGIDLKRFNVSVLDKPTEIMTEVFLKRITVRNLKDKQNYQLQITKKETWKGVTKKIQENWTSSGFIYEQKSNKELIPVNQNAVLEQIDTVGKVFVYSQTQPKQKPKTKQIERCEKCKKSENIKFCQCRSVKYCSMECLKADRDRHRKKCQLELAHLKQKSAALDAFKLEQKPFGGRKGLVGLRNLGNTCYMNSGLQCLSNTKEITEYFMSNNFVNDINCGNPLGYKGNLACTYAKLIRELWGGSDSSVSPYDLKKMMGKVSGQFSGYGQQDSQELISQLLDGLLEDLNLVKQKQTFQSNDKEISDEQGSLESQQNYAKRIQSYVRSLMVGQFKSTVICNVCDRKSICFDPYMLISLPIPSSKDYQLFFIPSNVKKGALKLKFQYDNTVTFGFLKENIRSFYRKDIQENAELLMTFVNLDTMQIVGEPKDEDNLSSKILDRKAGSYILCYELPKKKPEHQIYRVQYLATVKNKETKISYPKFMNLPLEQKDVQKILIDSYQKYVEKKTPSSYLVEIKKKENIIEVKLKQDIKMLVCTTQRQRLKLFKEEKINLDSCFRNYANPELLEGKNEWYCNKCKKFVSAIKKMEIYKSNKILVLAFKRFNRVWKMKNFINFPINQLDMAPYILSNKQKKPMIYELYGVVNHYGSMGGGHYTAFCRNFLNNRWYEFDDSRVSEINPKSAVSESAYVLFYRRKQN